MFFPIFLTLLFSLLFEDTEVKDNFPPRLGCLFMPEKPTICFLFPLAIDSLSPDGTTSALSSFVGGIAVISPSSEIIN